MSALLSLHLVDHFYFFLMVLTRIGALVMTAPHFGLGLVPMRIKALIAIGISILIVPLQPELSPTSPSNLLALSAVLVQEAMLGLALGLAAQILFGGLQVAGQIAGQLSGMSMANVTDPTFQDSVPIFGQLLHIIATLVFLSIGGHRLLLEALLDSFAWMPPGETLGRGNVADALTQVLSASFVLGVRASGPIMISTLLSLLVMSFVGRTLPQLNVFSMSFSVNPAVALGVMAASLGGIVWIFQDQVPVVVEIVQRSFMEPP